MDEYTDALDSVRITPYGLYLFKDLAQAFSYLDLVSCDCGVFDEKTANQLAFYSNSEYTLWSRGMRVDRLEARIKRAETFITYLEKEEAKEVAFFSLQNRRLYTADMRERFNTESANAMRSARRQRDRR